MKIQVFDFNEMDSEKEMKKDEEEIELVDNDSSDDSMEDENNVDEEEESHSEEPLTEEIEELIAELLEVESKAAEAQETLEEEPLVKVEVDVRKELAQSPFTFGTKIYARVKKVEEIDDVDDTSSDPFVADAIANERDLYLTEEQKRNFIKVKEEDDANADLKLHNRLKRRRRKQLKEDRSYRVMYRDELSEFPRLHFGRIINEGKLTTRGGWSKLHIYASYLSDQNRIQASCYPQLGNFLKLDVSGKFKGMMYHQLMIRLMERPQNKNLYEFWFLINEKPVRFSAIEFALVSGLRFRCKLQQSELEKMEVSTLKSRYFPDKGANMVSVSNVETQLVELKKQNIETTNRLKLVFVLIVSNFLLPTRKGYIDDYIFEVCDNLEICEKYDWGKRCWDKAYWDIVNRVDKHVSSFDGKQENWESPGCPWFVMFWMLEAIQDMDTAMHSIRLHDISNVYPRMLRWKLCSRSPNNNTSAKFLNKVKVVIPQLMADFVEQDMPYMKKINKFMKDANASARIYKNLRKTVKNVELHDRVVEHEDMAESEEDATEPENMENVGPTTSQIPSTSNVEDMPPWAIQFDQRFRAFENRLAAESQLAEQRHAQIMQAIQQIDRAEREY